MKINFNLKIVSYFFVSIYIKIFIINKYKLLNKYFAFSNYIKINLVMELIK